MINNDKISDEIIEKLQHLKGINLDAVYRICKEKRLSVKYKGFSESAIALLIDKNLPENRIGMDFQNLFEVKEVKIKYTKRKHEMRTGGDTAISAYLETDCDFFKSNIWDKSSRILIICVDQNRVVVDARFFDGERYAYDMKKDYDSIKISKNLCRKDNKFLVFKTGRNSIMLKGNIAIDMSESIFSDKIIDQDSYTYFDDKITSYKDRNNSDFETACFLIDNFNATQLTSIIEKANIRIKKIGGFINIEPDLPF